jgi:hypothetical protein
MNRPGAAVVLGCLLSALGGVAAVPVTAQEKRDTGISVLAGEWQIDYTYGAVRTYVVEPDGKVSGTAEEEKLKGRITRKDGTLILIMEGDGKLERLTLGTDGRLFVEHYGNAADYPEKRATHIGIGVRQK